MTDPAANHLLFALLLLGAVGSGLVGGIFFAFSTFVMAALDRLPRAQAVAAMQAINVTVLNPLFFTAFFGTAAVALAIGIAAIWTWSGRDSLLMLAGALAYLAGCILVTMRRNVPLNDRLARTAGDADRDAAWRDYNAPWTRWNTVRTVASLAASVAFVLAMRV